jgi:hypothetical protein
MPCLRANHLMIDFWQSRGWSTHTTAPSMPRDHPSMFGRCAAPMINPTSVAPCKLRPGGAIDVPK